MHNPKEVDKALRKLFNKIRKIKKLILKKDKFKRLNELLDELNKKIER